MWEEIISITTITKSRIFIFKRQQKLHQFKQWSKVLETTLRAESAPYWYVEVALFRPTLGTRMSPGNT